MITVKIIVHVSSSDKTRHPSPLCSMTYTSCIILMTYREFLDNRRHLYRAAFVCKRYTTIVYHVCVEMYNVKLTILTSALGIYWYFDMILFIIFIISTKNKDKVYYNYTISICIRYKVYYETQ